MSPVGMSENSKRHWLHDPFFPDDDTLRVCTWTVQVPSRSYCLYQGEWQNQNFPQSTPLLRGCLYHRYSLGDTRGFAGEQRERRCHGMYHFSSHLTCALITVGPCWLSPSVFALPKGSKRSLMRLKPDPGNPQPPGSGVGLENSLFRCGFLLKFLWKVGGS